MRASKMLWGTLNLEGLKSAKTYELLEKASIIYYNFDDKKIYSYLPIGQLLIIKLESIIRKEMNKHGIQEVYLSPIQPYELWKISGRDEKFGKKMIFLKGYSGISERYVLSPTNEEVAIAMAKKLVTSYRQLPISFYQFSDKFRDDPSAKHGIVRSNVFRILEAYSFNLDEKCLESTAETFFQIFMNIFKELDLKVLPIEKREGYITFLSISDEGDTKIAKCACGTKIFYPKMGKFCENCGQGFKINKGIELGCIVKLGSYFSEKFNAYYLTQNGEKKPIYLGTYGLGLSRIIHSVAEQHRDEVGIKWPKSLTPIMISVIPVDVSDEKQLQYATFVYEKIKNSGKDVILEDRNKDLGWKVRLYDLIGVPIKLIVGRREVESNTITIQDRKRKQKTIPLEELDNLLEELYEG